MRVKVFEASDMTSGLKQVRKELGPDALILSTKTVRNGKMGILGKSTIEITAAIDTPGSPAKPSPQERYQRPVQRFRRKTPRDTVPGMRGNHINHVVDYDLDGPDYSIPFPEPEEDGYSNAIPFDDLETDENNGQELKGEAAELKGMFQQLSKRMSGKGKQEAKQDKKGDGPSVRSDDEEPKKVLPEPVKRDPVKELLTSHGIDSSAMEPITTFAKEHMSGQDMADPSKVRRMAIHAIEDLVNVSPPDFNAQEGQYRIALVGPTGVGKTTTLAKLAAHYLSNHSNSVALITIDTYRIAAVEQLRVYGEIMYLPVEVVISPDQLDKALDRHSDKDLILIDTAGRSPKDSMSIQELTPFLRPDLNIEKHLVLSAPTRERELLDTIKRFEKIGIDKTIFTKIDECSSNGSILNVQTQNDIPLSYITNGQRVPEDLLQINKRSVAELIMYNH